MGWPGFGPTPAEPNIKGIGDLVARVIGEIQGPTALIAQSMGGVIAVLAALEKPQPVTHLVLTVTSGGVDMASFEAQDWRPSFFAANPSFPRWFSTLNEDLTEKLSSLNTPTLLLWGDADPISPIRVGQRLASLIPHAKLHIFPGGDHFLANTLAHNVAPLIDEHLSKAA
jgi:pimeloyl-ACP methyl ester carboxylesterase